MGFPYPELPKVEGRLTESPRATLDRSTQQPELVDQERAANRRVVVLQSIVALLGGLLIFASLAADLFGGYPGFGPIQLLLAATGLGVVGASFGLRLKPVKEWLGGLKAPSRRLTPKTLAFYAVAVVVLPLAVSLPIAEAWLRIADIPYETPATLANASLQYEPSLFSRHVFPRKVQERGGAWYINEKGYRGLDFAVLKPPGTTRIMAYGGSAVFNISQDRDRDWPHRVERMLRGGGLPRRGGH